MDIMCLSVTGTTSQPELRHNSLNFLRYILYAYSIIIIYF